jgi:hypothetical protein
MRTAMEMHLTFLDCPEYMDNWGTVRCALPAEIECRYTVGSTDGPLESAKIRCPRGHWFNGTIESLTWPKECGPAIARKVGTLSADTRPPARKASAQARSRGGTRAQ